MAERPLVLGIGPREQAMDGLRGVNRIRGARGIAGAVHGEDGRRGLGVDGLVEERESCAERVPVPELQAAVALDAPGVKGATHVAGHPVEIEIAHRVGHEVHAALAAECRHLVVEVARSALVGRDSVKVLLVLVFVELRRVEGARQPWVAVGGGARGQPRGVGDLEAAARGAAHEGQAAVAVEDVGEVGERLVLVRGVVNGVGAPGRVLDPEFVVVVACVRKVAEIAAGAAGLDARAHGAEAPSVERGLAALVEPAGLRLDVDDPRTCGSRTGPGGARDQLHALDESRIELEPESGDAFGKEHVVDAVLEIGVFAAHVQVAVRRRVLGDARRAQENLAERRVDPPWQVEDLRLVHAE